MYTYQIDLSTKEVKAQCDLYPTEVTNRDAYWLHAENNKYDNVTVRCEKIGKWMLFLTKDQVNTVWDKIKQAIANGDLWSSKVSTYSPQKPRDTHAIMIYTKDYTDKSDVINVLDFLESSGITDPQKIIRYKTDQQTQAGIYSGGKQKPWIYSSDAIRGSAHSPDWRKRTN